MSKRVPASFRVSNEGQVPVVTVTPRVLSSRPPAPAPAEPQPHGVVLTDNTSLDELFTAILGGDAREQDDRGPLLEAVDAQVSRLRKELGLAEPPRPPAPPPAAPQAIQALDAAEAPFETEVPGGPTVWLRRRFEALRQGMPDVWSSVPRPLVLGLPAAALVVVGAMWLGSADSRPREVAAAAAPAPVLSTAAPVRNEPVVPADTVGPIEGATPSPSVPVSTSASTLPSASAGSSSFAAPARFERARGSRGRVAGGGTDEGLARASDATTATSAARPVPSASSPLADVASPAAPTAAAGSTPTAAPSSAASAAAASFAASGVTTLPPPAPLNEVSAPVGATTNSPAAVMPPAAAPTASATSDASAAPTAPAPTTPASATPAAPAPGLGVSQPAALLSRVTPVYPEAARRARVTGTVDVVLSIDKQGTVVRATAVEGSPLLRPSAEDAARKWRYRPELVNGAPVETERRVRIVFQ